MDSLIYSLIFVLLAVTVWEITCDDSASLSFIQQEQQPGLFTSTTKPLLVNSQVSNSNNNRRDYVNPNIPKRDYINPNLPNSGTHTTSKPKTAPLTNPPTAVPHKTNNPRRDYVNPNRPNSGSTHTTSKPKTVPSTNPLTTVPHKTSSPGRDYVNPNFPNQNNPNIAKTPTIQSYADKTKTGSTHHSSPINSPTVAPHKTSNPGRDYVNPNFPNQNNPNTAKTPIIQSYADKAKTGSTHHSSTTPGPITSRPTTSTTRQDEATDAELQEYSEAILKRDVNNAAKYVTENLQGRTTSQSKIDQAPQRLLTIQSEAYAIPTIAKIKQLHNNYILDSSENEYVTGQEKNEENELLDTILTTPIMQYTRNFLISKGKLTRDPKDFKNLLKLLWFHMYSRGGGRIGSSGFEHIFLAELKKTDVSGMHNWLYFDQAETQNIVDYLGYMKKLDLGEKGSILKFHFKLNGVDKPVGSMFVGTSPELEMALYTTCYIFRADRHCPLRLNGNNFVIRTYNYRYRGKNTIGSAFPEI